MLEHWMEVCRHDCITQATDGRQALLIPLPQPTCLPPAEGLSLAFTSVPCLGKLQGTGISPQLTSLPVDLKITAGVGVGFQQELHLLGGWEAIMI